MESEKEEIKTQEEAEKKEKETDRKDCENLEDSDTLYKNIEQPEERKNIYIDYRTINNYGVIAGDDANFENITLHESKAKKGKSGQKNILADEEQFCNWLLDNYGTYSLALLIASAVFERLPYAWMLCAADDLYSFFEKKNEEEERKYGITDILNAFCAKICQGEMNTHTGKIPIEVVRFAKEEYREKILKYIWKECPKLHDQIVLWLKKYNMKKPIPMSKRASQIMGQLAYWDYYYFQSSMIGMIQHDKKASTDMLIAQVIVSLNQHREYQENIHNLMQSWNTQGSAHYLLTNLFVCSSLNSKGDILENAIHRYVQEIMDGIERKRENEWRQNIYDFFASGIRAFTFYRILIEQLYELACNKTTPRQKRDVCYLFLSLFAVDVNLAQLEKGEDAILVRLCRTRNEVSEKTTYLWQLVWKCGYYRQALYDFLAVYDRELRKAGKDNLEDFIEEVLGDVCTKETQRDICNKVRRRIKDE